MAGGNPLRLGNRSKRMKCEALRRRDQRRRMFFENLEDRRLLAGLKLVDVKANQQTLQGGERLEPTPTTNLDFRFDAPLNLTNFSSLADARARFILRNLSTATVINPAEMAVDAMSSATDVTLQYGNLQQGLYELRLLSGSDGVVSETGEQLDGDGDGTPGDDFALQFTVDTTEIEDIAINPVAPAGTNLGVLNANRRQFSLGDVDRFRMAVSGNQKLSLAFESRTDGLEATLRLLDSGGQILAEDDSSDGLAQLEHSLPADGAYEVQVEATAGSGLYELTGVVGAKIEAESLGAASNDSQGESLTFDTLAGTVQSASVAGRVGDDTSLREVAATALFGDSLNFVATAAHHPDGFIVVLSGRQLSKVTDDGRVHAMGVVSFDADDIAIAADGAIWAGENNSNRVRRIDPATGDTLDVVTVTPTDSALDDIWAIAIDHQSGRLYGYTYANDAFQLLSADLATGQAQLTETDQYIEQLFFNNSGNLFAVSGTALYEWNEGDVRFDQLGSLTTYSPPTGFDPGRDAFFVISSSRVSFHRAQDISDNVDLFQINLNANEPITILNHGGAVLELLAPDGHVIAQESFEDYYGVFDFIPSSSGTYTAELTGFGLEDYVLTVLRDTVAATKNSVNSLSLNKNAIGRLGDGVVGVFDTQSDLAFAVSGHETYDLEGRPYYFLGGLDGLSNLDTAFFGNYLSAGGVEESVDALVQWVHRGGGLIVNADFSDVYADLDAETQSKLDELLPISLQAGLSTMAGNVTPATASHPLMEDVVAFSTTGVAVPNDSQLAVGATLVATLDGQPAVVEKAVGLGRVVYSGLSEQRDTEALQVAVNAAAWITQTRQVFSIEFAEGQQADFTTTTPWLGDEYPGNQLNPRLALFDPAGKLVSDADDNTGDGRNANLQYTPVNGQGGEYELVLLSKPMGGQYILVSSGTTRSIPEFIVENSDVPTAPSSYLPSTFELILSGAVDKRSVEANDLTINGTPFSSVFVNGDSLRFRIEDFDGGDGDYTVAAAQGAWTSLQGVASQPFSQTFAVDSTPPRVVATTLPSAGFVPEGPLDITLTISEPVDPDLLVNRTFFLQQNGVDQIASVQAEYDVDQQELSISFDHIVEGLYELVLPPSYFVDQAQHWLDGNADGTGGDAYRVSLGADTAERDLEPFELAGSASSLSYGTTTHGSFYGTNDEDIFDVSVDSGQQVSFILESHDDAVAALEVRDSSGNVLASSAASQPGETVQVIGVNGTGGLLRAVARSTQGGGDFSLTARTNTLLERETPVGSTNNTLETAELIPLGAPLLSTASSTYLLGQVGRLEEGLQIGATASIVGHGYRAHEAVDGFDEGRGFPWHSGAYWYNNAQLHIDLGEAKTFNAVRLQAEYDDEYLIEYQDGTGDWMELVTVPRYTNRGVSGLISRPDFGYTDSEPYLNLPVTTAQHLRVSGIGSFFGVGELHLAFVEDTDVDYYEVDLPADTSTELRVEGEVQVEVLNEAGELYRTRHRVGRGCPANSITVCG